MRYEIGLIHSQLNVQLLQTDASERAREKGKIKIIDELWF